MAKATVKPVVGVDLGGTKILAAVVDGENKILSRFKKRTKLEGGPEGLTERICQAVEGALVTAKLTPADVAAIGVGAAGPTDTAAGVVVTMPNLGIENLPLGKRLTDRFSVPARIENDVNCGTIAECRLGAGKGAADVLGVFPGTGIGGGILVGGTLLRGRNQAAAEIGHTVIDPNGPLCACGVHGCLEAYASRLAIVRDIAAAVGRGEASIAGEYIRPDGTNRLRSKALARGVTEGDKVITDVLERAARMLGEAIGSAINLLGCELVILGGGVTEALGSWLVNRVAAAAEKRALKIAFKGVRIVQASLGDDAICLGAALLAREALAENK
jgi:glucokinase